MRSSENNVSIRYDYRVFRVRVDRKRAGLSASLIWFNPCQLKVSQKGTSSRSINIGLCGNLVLKNSRPVNEAPSQSYGAIAIWDHTVLPDTQHK